MLFLFYFNNIIVYIILIPVITGFKNITASFKYIDSSEVNVRHHLGFIVQRLKICTKLCGFKE